MSLKAEFSKTEEDVLVGMVQHYPYIYNPGNPAYKDNKVKEESWVEVAGKVGRTVDECKWRWKNVKDTYVKRKRKGTLEGPGTTYWHLAKSLQFLDQVEFKQRHVSSQKTLPTDAEPSDQDVEFVDIQQVVPEASASSSVATKRPTPPEANERRTHRRKRNRHKIIRLPPVTKVSVDSIEPADSNTETNLPDIVEVEPNKPPQISLAPIPQLPIMQLPHVDFADSTGNMEDHVEVFFRSVALSVKSFPKHMINEAKLRTLQMLVEMETKIMANNHGYIIAPNYAGITYATFDGSNSLGSNSTSTSN